MARKKLIKGPNAERVEQRIAQVPKDITETSIFKVLKEIEEKSKTQNQEILNEIVTEEEAEKVKEQPKKDVNEKRKISKKARTKKSKKKLSPLQEALIGEVSPVHEEKPEGEEKTEEKGKSKKRKAEKKISFTKAEKEIIVKSCINYKNSLPIYLKSVQREVKLIDNVIKKLK